MVPLLGVVIGAGPAPEPPRVPVGVAGVAAFWTWGEEGIGDGTDILSGFGGMSQVL